MFSFWEKNGWNLFFTGLFLLVRGGRWTGFGRLLFKALDFRRFGAKFACIRRIFAEGSCFLEGGLVFEIGVGVGVGGRLGCAGFGGFGGICRGFAFFLLVLRSISIGWSIGRRVFRGFFGLGRGFLARCGSSFFPVVREMEINLNINKF